MVARRVCLRKGLSITVAVLCMIGLFSVYHFHFNYEEDVQMDSSPRNVQVVRLIRVMQPLLKVVRFGSNIVMHSSLHRVILAYAALRRRRDCFFFFLLVYLINQSQFKKQH